jgi:hypothetical protein
MKLLERLRAELAEARRELEAERKMHHGWLAENSPGGWIDSLRKRAHAAEQRLAEARRELNEQRLVDQHRALWLACKEARDAALDRISSLESECEGLRADAERYRWLRREDRTPRPIVCSDYEHGAFKCYTPEELDAVIDAQLRSSGKWRS